MDDDRERGAAPPPAVPAAAKAGRNLPIAIAVGVGLAALVLVSLYTVRVIFLAVMVLFLGQAMRELTVALRVRGIVVPQLPLVVAVVAAAVAAYLAGTEGLVAAVAITVVVLLSWRLMGGSEGYVRDATAAVFATGYIVLMAGVVALMLAPGDGDHRIVIFIAVTAFSDIGGFFAGSFLGRHPMAPRISPKKTWEGFAGSALACMAVGAWLVPWLLDGEIWMGVLLGAAVVCSASVGDLIESMIKRDLGIKDLGTLLPGHGGVMDRLDSLIITAPVVWLLLELFVPSAG
jgi:phosphatidate cytidylyltransferase